MAIKNSKLCKIDALSSRQGPVDAAFILVCLLAAYVLVLNAWVSDDWFIGLRQIRNFIHGHGLVWNLGERVQTFTCPLWMFLFAPFYALSEEAFYTTLFVQVLLSFAVLFLARRVWSGRSDFFFFSGLLLLSSGLSDYLTSGTESILSLFLFSFFFGHFFNPRVFSRNTQLVCASLLLLNRLDFILILGPWLALTYSTCSISFIQGLMTTVPALLWAIFSLIYFGWPLPTTFYSKLTHSVSWTESLWQGLAYLKVNFMYDPLFVAVCFFSLIWVVWRQKYQWAGILLYVFYIVWAGGDFMVARLLTPVYLFGAFALTYELQSSLSFKKVVLSGGLALCLGLSFLGTKSPVVFPDNRDELLLESGIADEKRFYHNKGQSFYARFVLGRDRTLEHEQGVAGFLVTPFHGVRGHYSQEDFYILDPSGIGSPYMLGFPTVESARVGHYFRRVPLEVVDHFAFHQKIEHEQLRFYIEDVKLAMSADLWSKERWRAIWRLNTWDVKERLSYFWSLPQARFPVDEDLEGQGKYYLQNKE